jgi:hypothetical protein
VVIWIRSPTAYWLGRDGDTLRALAEAVRQRRLRLTDEAQAPT